MKSTIKKNQLKKIISSSKSYIVTLTLLLSIFILNFDKYEINKKLYGIGYELYSESALFFQRLYRRVFPVQITENKEILREKAYLENEYNTLLQENSFLKKQLHLFDNKNYNYKYLSAWVTQVTHPKGEKALVISVGDKDGVKLGNVVINEKGIIGRVSGTTEKSSLVSLIGNENVKISAVILPSYHNCIIGKNMTKESDKLKLSVGYLHENNGVEEGDLVISSGKDGMTPFGLALGMITKSENKLFVLSDKIGLDSLIVRVIIN